MESRTFAITVPSPKGMDYNTGELTRIVLRHATQIDVDSISGVLKLLDGMVLVEAYAPGAWVAVKEKVEAA